MSGRSAEPHSQVPFLLGHTASPVPQSTVETVHEDHPGHSKSEPLRPREPETPQGDTNKPDVTHGKTTITTYTLIVQPGHFCTGIPITFISSLTQSDTVTQTSIAQSYWSSDAGGIYGLY